MKTILVTGAEGFIGRHVCKILRTRGDIRLETLDCWEPRVHDVVGDRPRYCSEAFKVCDPDIIIHLAAQVGVADSQVDPMRYIIGNTVDTTEMLVNLRNTKRLPTRLVVASSMSVYGDCGHLVSEYDEVDPQSIYGLSKYDQEMLVRNLAPTMGYEAAALRFFNVYGPGQALCNPYTGVIANFVNQLQQGEPPTVYEDGLQTRDFIYVTDVARAIVTVALHPEPLEHEVYNVCTGAATTIKQMAETLANAMDLDIEPNITGETRDGDIRHATGDNTRISDEFGWFPEFNISEGIDAYVRGLSVGVN